jgi:hypothetical protein
MAGQRIGIIYICLIGITVCVFADKIIFQEEETKVWYSDNFIHLTVDIDLSPIMAECDELTRLIPELTKKFTAITVSEAALQSKAAQVCSVTQHFNSTHVLDKRQAMFLAALAAGSIFGMFNAGAISRLSTRVDALDKTMSRGLIILRREETCLIALDRQVRQMNAEMIRQSYVTQEKVSQIQLLQSLNFHMDTLGLHTSSLNTAWAALIEGHLNWGLLAPRQWEKIANRIKKEATRMGGTVPFGTPLDLLQFPASFQATGKKWRIFLHLPVIQEEMRLYRYFPAPIYIDHPSNQSARVVTLQSKHPLLLVTPDDMLHQELSEQDLMSRCHRLGSRRICQDLGTFKRNLAASCLGSLFAHLTEDAFRHCDLQPFVEEWSVLTINPATRMLFSKSGRSVDTICSNGSRYNQMIRGIAVLHLDPGCALSSSEFLTRRSKQERLTVEVVHEPAWETGRLQAMLEASQQSALNDSDQMNRRLQALEAKAQMSPDQADLEWIDRQLHPAHPEGRLLLRGLLAATALLALILTGALGYLAWRYYSVRPEPQPVTADSD